MIDKFSVDKMHQGTNVRIKMMQVFLHWNFEGRPPNCKICKRIEMEGGERLMRSIQLTTQQEEFSIYNSFTTHHQEAAQVHPSQDFIFHL